MFSSVLAPCDHTRRSAMNPAISTETSVQLSADSSSGNKDESGPISPDTSLLFRVYNPPESSGTTLLTELTDSDFEPTTAELQAAYAGQKQKLNAIANAPFKTQAVREREQKAKANRWPKVASSDQSSSSILIIAAYLDHN